MSRILSPIGSSMAPSSDSALNFLARYPSKKSLRAAKKQKMNKQIRYCSKKVNTNIKGPTIILDAVRIRMKFFTV